MDGENAPVETEIEISGNRGSDSPGRSENRIRSEDYPDRLGVDKVLACVTLEQFGQLAEAVGMEMIV